MTDSGVKMITLATTSVEKPVNENKFFERIGVSNGIERCIYPLVSIYRPAKWFTVVEQCLRQVIIIIESSSSAVSLP